MPPEIVACALVALTAATMLAVQIIGIARDTDWWVITRDTARGRAEQVARSIRRN